MRDLYALAQELEAAFGDAFVREGRERLRIAVEAAAEAIRNYAFKEDQVGTE